MKRYVVVLGVGFMFLDCLIRAQGSTSTSFRSSIAEMLKVNSRITGSVLGVGVFNCDGDLWQFHRKRKSCVVHPIICSPSYQSLDPFLLGSASPISAYLTRNLLSLFNKCKSDSTKVERLISRSVYSPPFRSASNTNLYLLPGYLQSIYHRFRM